MRPARNRWMIGVGLGVAAPWLLAFLVGSITAPFMVPAEFRREAVLGTIALNLLFAIGHIAAAMGVWLAAYQISGSETLEVSPAGSIVRRRGMGVTVPIKLPRDADEQIRLVDVSQYPGRWGHPRLEIRAGGSAMRFGTGLTEEQAAAVKDAVEEVMVTTRP